MIRQHQSVSPDGRQECDSCSSSLLWLGFHMFWYGVLQLILGFCKLCIEGAEDGFFGLHTYVTKFTAHHSSADDTEDTFLNTFLDNVQCTGYYCSLCPLEWSTSKNCTLWNWM